MLADAHAALDAAVAAAYVWNAGISEDEALTELVMPNRNRDLRKDVHCGQGKVMSKIGESPVSIRNYWLEKHIEEENATSEDGTEFIWRYDNRIRIVESLIRDTAHYGRDVARLSQEPSFTSEGDAVLECIEGGYDIAKAKSWIFSHLYQHAIRQANAIYVLFLTSHFSQGFQLWRSLFEAHVICEFLSRHISNKVLIQDYISHTLLRSSFRMMERVNELCEHDGMELKYTESRITSLKDLYKSKGWKPSEEYAWAQSVLGKKRITFHDILGQVDSDMAVFYRLSSMEIHPTMGQRFVLLGIGLPLSAVPTSVFGVIDKEELQLDFLTAKVLHRVTCRADRFICFDEGMGKRLESLKTSGLNVLEERKRATSPIRQGGRRLVVHRGD